MVNLRPFFTPCFRGVFETVFCKQRSDCILPYRGRETVMECEKCGSLLKLEMSNLGKDVSCWPITGDTAFDTASGP